MKAILFHEHGGLDKLQYEDIPTPEPKAGQVRIKLHAAALNHLDLWVREGWPSLKLAYPHIPGADGAGVIDGIGEGVEGLSLDTPVAINANISDGTCEYCLAGQDNMCLNWHLLGETTAGTYAEYIVVPAVNAVPTPIGFDPNQAAAASLVFQTAWHSLITRGRLQAGESVLIVGASGGVNTASIQIAKYAGAEVYVVGSSAKKLTLAESLGADHLINYSEDENWSKTIYKMTKNRGIDVIVDNVGTTYAQSMRAARRGGRILTVGNTGGPKFEIDNRYIFGKHLSIIGSTMGTHKDFRDVMGLLFEGKFKAVVDKSFPLMEAAAAQEYLASGEQMGKVTLAIS